MLNALVRFSLRNPAVVFVVTAILIGLGIFSFVKLPIDAVPDITNVQVQVLTTAPSLGAVDVEKLITTPVEIGMSGLPALAEIRSISRPGLSAVTLVFDEGTDIYWARQLVMERVQEVREDVPSSLGSISLGPIASGLGEIYQFEIKGHDYSPMQLRTILDWQVAYRLRSVPGVVEVNTWGGLLKTYEVQVDPQRLRSFNIGLNQVFEALEKNNANAGGAYIEKAGNAVFIRGEALLGSLEGVGEVVVSTTRQGTPVLLRQLAQVALAPMPRYGAVTRDGRGEAVIGIVMMLLGQNSREVAQAVQAEVDKIQGSLPPGVTIDPFYDRTELVGRTIATVARNLLEGGVLVIGVLLLMLGNLPAGLMVSLVIPLSMLLAFIGMRILGVSGNLMSLGAIDFGIIVDGAVIMVENIYWRLLQGAPHRSRRETIYQAAAEVAAPIFFAISIVVLVFLPIFGLQSIEGKMFKPMAFAFVFALLGSLLLTYTLMPVLAWLGLKPSPGGGHHDPRLLVWLKRLYRPLLERATRHPVWMAGLAAAIFATSVVAASRMGFEFIPRLEEGSLMVEVTRLPSVGLDESVRNTTHIETVLKKFPQVISVISKTGRAEIATDPMGFESSDVVVLLKPPAEWPDPISKDELIEAMSKALEANVSGTAFGFSQPIELRFSELISGTRGDVAVKIFGPDMDVLTDKAQDITRVLASLPGAADTKAEQVAGSEVLRIIVNREAIARYGVAASDVLDVISTLGAHVVGQVQDAEGRFALTVRLAPEDRRDLHAVRNLPVAAQGRLIPLGQLADIKSEEAPNQISREQIHRRIAVTTNVRGRDLGRFVQEAQQAVHRKVKLPPGYYLVWGGQFENLERALARLELLFPLAFILIFVLLYMSLGTARPALLIFLNVPVAASGGVFILLARGMPFSISAAIGFIALFGVAVMNGLVLLTYIREQIALGASVQDIIVQGPVDRMRAMLMAPMVAALGFMPMAFSHGAGAEVQRPLATVVIGGLITSTCLTLFVLPALYPWFHSQVEDDDE